LGAEVLDQGEDLGRVVAEVTAQLVSDGSALSSGWASLGAVRSAAIGWSEYLSRLSGRAEAAGQSMVAAANGYQGSDERAEQRLRSGGVLVR
jgi:hypothetical protein